MFQTLAATLAPSSRSINLDLTAMARRLFGIDAEAIDLAGWFGARQAETSTGDELSRMALIFSDARSTPATRDQRRWM